jgi:hypothetical protein
MPWQRGCAARAYTDGVSSMPLILPHFFTPERIADFWSRVDRSGEHWLWLDSLTVDGYGYTRGFVDSTSGGAHRVAWFLATGEDPGSNHVLHTCDIPRCVRNDGIGVYSVAGIEYPRRGHLFLGDNSANIKDRSQKYWARKRAVDSEIITEIRRLHHSKRTSYFILAWEFGIPIRVIRDIVNHHL